MTESFTQSRKKARDSAFKLVYEYLFLGKPNGKSFDIFTGVDISNADREYITAVYYGVIEHYHDLIDLIETYAKGFSIDRIYKPDLAAMLLACYEMKYMPEIPVSVSINEAIELVKTYGAENSRKFVNGILGSVSRVLETK